MGSRGEEVNGSLLGRTELAENQYEREVSTLHVRASSSYGSYARVSEGLVSQQ